jgi:beta-N-acetylhexosaminidase
MITAAVCCAVLAASPLEELPLRQKIGQLFVVPAAQLLGDAHVQDLYRLIEEVGIGGVLLKQGTIEGQRALISKLQSRSVIPLLCVQDAEWGVSMRLTDAEELPRNLTLGAIQDLSLLYAFGKAVGAQCARVGTHLNLAPVVDVNSNPINPIIHMRSFGEDPAEVAQRATLVIEGMQSQGVLACAKHFPGHGDTSADSHVELPCVRRSLEQIKATELVPFSSAVCLGVDAVMTAHIDVRALSLEPGVPATFSRRIVHDLLQSEMGFQGLVISDALNMKALSLHHSDAEIAVRAVRAGHDLLLYGDHIAPYIEHIVRVSIPAAVQAIEQAVHEGLISEEDITARVEKIWRVKERLRKEVYEPGEVNSEEIRALKSRLFEEAMTLVKNEAFFPLKRGEKVAVVEWGDSPALIELLSQSIVMERFSIEDPDLEQRLVGWDRVLVICSVFKQFSKTEEQRALLSRLRALTPSKGIVLLGSPYGLSELPPFEGVLVAYENDPEAQRAAARVVLGDKAPKGRLPVSVEPEFLRGSGLCTALR